MDTAEWASWWRKTGEDQLRALVMAVWDPIGVADAPQAYDEYDSYLPAIGKALRGGADSSAIAFILMDTRRNWDDERDEPSEHDSAAAETIKRWYDAEMFRNGERGPEWDAPGTEASS